MMGVQKKDMRRGATPGAIFLAIMAAVLMSGRCSLFRGGAAAPVLREDFSLLPPADFPGKIKELEGISQNDKNASVRTRALFYVSLAHMHYRNPSPDYSRAAEYLDKYIALESAQKNKDIDEIVAWKSVLQTLAGSLRKYQELEKNYAQLKQQYDRANKNKGDLAKKVDELGLKVENQRKEMERLKKTIKELDTVQQEIEKKRRGIKKEF